MLRGDPILGTSQMRAVFATTDSKSSFVLMLQQVTLLLACIHKCIQGVTSSYISIENVSH